MDPISSDNDAVSMSALLILQQTNFTPPTHDGSRTSYVQMRQAMEFNTAPAGGTVPAGD